MKKWAGVLVVMWMISGCAVSKNFNPYRKFSPQQLQNDYTLFRNILEESHPGLYWYTPKDSMDYYFEQGQSMLRDSLNESKFSNVLRYVVAKIHCGHTSVIPSKPAARYRRRVRTWSFPLNLKIWKDTAVVTSNLNRRDSNIVRGVVVTAIDNKPLISIVDSLFHYLPSDGYNTSHKYQYLSGWYVFANFYNSVFGLRTKYLVHFIDTSGRKRVAYTNLYNPILDTSKRTAPPLPELSRRKRKKLIGQANRNFKIDTALQTGFMDLNTFVKGYNLRSFFKSSFKKLKKSNTQNLVIDLRGNGGGSVTNSTLLSRYIADKRFRLADSLYAIRRGSRYGRYRQHHFWNWLFIVFMTHRKQDGNYHFNYFERHYYKPKRHYHFDGNVYILTGGNTFSASTLFIQSIKGQKNVTVVGEETGGGSYGNNAWLIPDVTLPNTKVRFRLPLFRLVINKDFPKTGRGVIPDVEAAPTVEAIRHNIDFKMEKAIELIKESNSTASH